MFQFVSTTAAGKASWMGRQIFHQKQSVAFLSTPTTHLWQSFRRSMTTMEATKRQQEEEEGVDALYDPLQFLKDGELPMPAALSPSAAMEFQACPQSYMFQYLFGLRQPTNLVLAKGSMCHKALEQVYDLEVNDRTLENLQNLLRRAWKENRNKEEYANLFTSDDDDENENGDEIQNEREWGLSALDLLSNYYQMEDPRLVPYPNPLEREVWVRANLSILHSNQGTLHNNDNNNNNNNNSADHHPKQDADGETFLVRGIVDRIDLVQFSKYSMSSQNSPIFALRIIDYKTGKAPVLKYSPAMNSKIAEEKFWQLKIYALLLREMMMKNPNGKGIPRNLSHIADIVADKQTEMLDVRILRLMFLTSEDGVGQYIDMDLGETKEERDATLDQVHTDLSNIWKDIQRLVSLQDPKEFVHCDRPWCYCHKIRPKFLAGTVWDKENEKNSTNYSVDVTI